MAEVEAAVDGVAVDAVVTTGAAAGTVDMAAMVAEDAEWLVAANFWPLVFWIGDRDDFAVFFFGSVEGDSRNRGDSNSITTPLNRKKRD